jgi:hypothetical protein
MTYMGGSTSGRDHLGTTPLEPYIVLWDINLNMESDAYVDHA